MTRLVDQLFIFSYCWSIGGNLMSTYTEQFDTFMRDSFEKVTQLPGSHMLSDYFVDVPDCSFKMWSDIVPKFVFKRDTPFFNLIVPTVDTVRYAFLSEVLISAGTPVLLVGESGVGKSVIMQSLLSKMAMAGRLPPPAAVKPIAAAPSADGTAVVTQPAASLAVVNEGQTMFLPFTLTFTARTSSQSAQDIVESKLEQKKPNVIGAAGGKRFVMFVDDINMPKLDENGDQAPVELLRQYLDYGGIYARKEWSWLEVQDVTLAAACGPPGGGRNPMSSRFTRHFHLLERRPAQRGHLEADLPANRVWLLR